MSGKSRGYGITATAICFLAMGVVMLDRLSINFLMPVLAPQLGLTNTDIGLLNSVFSIAWAVSAFFVAGWSDKLGYRKRILVPCLIGTGVFMAAGVICNTVTQLIIVRTVCGIFAGPLGALLYAIVADASVEGTFGRNVGIVNAGIGAIGAAIAPIFITQLTAQYSWQNTFLVASIPTFVIVVAVILWIKEVEPKVADATVEQKSSNVYKDVMKIKNIPICVIMNILAVIGYMTVMIFAPLYLVNVAKLSVPDMGWVTSAMGVLYVVFGIATTKLSDNFGRKPVMLVCIVLSLLGPLAMYLAPGSMSATWMYVLFGGFVPAVVPFVMTIIPMESVPVRLIATSMVVAQAAGDLISGAIWPIIAGKIADAAGLPFMMLVVVILMAFSLVFAYFLDESNPKLRKPAKFMAS
jgi:MFS family permease